MLEMVVSDVMVALLCWVLDWNYYDLRSDGSHRHRDIFRRKNFLGVSVNEKNSLAAKYRQNSGSPSWSVHRQTAHPQPSPPTPRL